MVAPSLMESLFQRSLEDLIKSLRLTPTPVLPDFISKSVDEIRREIKSTDHQTKSIALQKITYLHSLHALDISWAAFHSVELSSSSSHSHKRVAFLSASLSFNPSTTEVILLLTHQLRKDLTSPNVHDVSIALSTLFSIANIDLSRDLTPELFSLLSSGKLFVRKKAIAAILRVFEQYPDAVRVCFKRVVDNLESNDMGVLSATLGLFCELTAKEPRSYLPLAPEFYKVLVECRNNWVLIKVLKIFALLAPLEPRLAKRIVEPVCEHLTRTGAKSLEFECVRTIVSSLSEYESAVKLAVAKIREFLSDDDSNLKYLGLQALSTVALTHMWAVLENRESIVEALSHHDVNIKLEALQLVMSMVSENNVVEICRILLGHALKSDPEFCNEILGSLLSTCSRNFYEVIFDFDWYVSFLGEITRIPHCKKGTEIETQLVDIGMRVKDARLELVHTSRDLVIDPALLGNPFTHQVLSAAAWVSGEYVEFSRNPLELMEALLQPRTSLLCPPVRAVYIQSAFKVLVFCMCSYISFVREDGLELSETETNSVDVSIALPNTSEEITAKATSATHHVNKESMMDLIQLAELNLGPLAGSSEVEVRERARNVIGICKLIKSKVLDHLDQLERPNSNEVPKAFVTIELAVEVFSEELGPVSANAQDRVPVPDLLDLKEDLSGLDAISSEFKLPMPTSFSLLRTRMEKNDFPDIPESESREEGEPSTESTSLLAEHRKRHGLYYLGSHSKDLIHDDYPPANDPNDNAVGEAEDLVKMAEKSLLSKKKPSHSRPRPVVVKLDDGEGRNDFTKVSDCKRDPISGAVQEVLLGNDSASSSSRINSSNKESKRKENTIMNADIGISRRKEDHIHGKDRNHTSSKKKKEERSNQDKQKKGRRHGKHKNRQRADDALNMAPQLPVIPDLLL